jgi:hypothetical protein
MGDNHPYFPHQRAEAAPGPTTRLRAAWRASHRFQMAAQKALGRNTFYEWLLLEALKELIDETGDAVSQIAIAKRAVVTKMMASYWMLWMEEHGLVSRGPSADGRAYRILLGELAEDTLRAWNERLEAAGIRDA